MPVLVHEDHPLSKIPSPDEVRRRIFSNRRERVLLRRLLELSQRVFADSSSAAGCTIVPSPRVEGEKA